LVGKMNLIRYLEREEIERTVKRRRKNKSTDVVNGYMKCDYSGI